MTSSPASPTSPAFAGEQQDLQATPGAQLPRWQTRVLPVVVISAVEQAVTLAQTLLEAGVDAIEVTLRHPCALEAMQAIARGVPGMHLGAGTVTVADDLQRCRDAGAEFALSPGCSRALLEQAARLALPFIPGVMTPGEALRAREQGWRLLKLFPAEVAGGVAWLQAVHGPLPDLRFCPTGGVSPDNLERYLALPNVPMVGGTWIAPLALVEQGDWVEIGRRARLASRLAAAAPRVAAAASR